MKRWILETAAGLAALLALLAIVPPLWLYMKATGYLDKQARRRRQGLSPEVRDF